MKCAWDELLGILPPGIRNEVNRMGENCLQELRMRVEKPIELVFGSKSCWLEREATKEDISYLVNAASCYSPWAADGTADGYITAPGGHRIGLCGDVAIKNEKISGFRRILSVCIRVARDFPGIAAPLKNVVGNILILGPPGSGKTTLLRDLIRCVGLNSHITVVDERGELFPSGLETGRYTDVLTGCRKRDGLTMAIRTMGPQCIAVDEITCAEDCDALTEAGWCGVRLLATAHAADIADLSQRRVYRPLLHSGLFDYAVVLDRNKQFRLERLTG